MKCRWLTITIVLAVIVFYSETNVMHFGVTLLIHICSDAIQNEQEDAVRVISDLHLCRHTDDLAHQSWFMACQYETGE